MGQSKKRLRQASSTLTMCKTKKKKTEMATKTLETSSLPYLPDELILFNVLTRLPIRSLRRFSCVNKIWCNTISGDDSDFNSSHLIHAKRRDPSFLFLLHEEEKEKGKEGDNRVQSKKVKQVRRRVSNYNFTSFDSELFKASFDSKIIKASKYFSHRSVSCGESFIIGDCNGLLCIKSMSGYEICNLSTHEVLLISRAPKFRRGSHYMKYGFGYDALANQYKIVQFAGKRCMVFTLGGSGTNANSWKDITHTLTTEVSRCLEGYSCFDASYQNRGLYSIGALNWFSEYDLISLDIHTEEFVLIPSPCYYLDRREYLFEFNGRPCVGFYKPLPDNDQMLEMNLVSLVKDAHSSDPWELLRFKMPNPSVSHDYVSVTSILGQPIFYWFDDKYPDRIITYRAFDFIYSAILLPCRDSFLCEARFICYTENLHSLKTLVPPGAGAGQVRYIQMPKQSRKNPQRKTRFD